MSKLASIMIEAEDIDPIQRAERASDRKRRERELNDPDARVHNDSSFNATKQSVIYGLVAGVALGAYQFLLNEVDRGIGVAMDFLSFLIFVPLIWYGLREYRQHLAAGEVFKNGIVYGFRVSVIGSFTAVLFNGLGFLIGGRATPELIGVKAISIGELMVDSAAQVLIGTVIGMIITFIILQGIKSDAPADEFIEEQEGHA